MAQNDQALLTRLHDSGLEFIIIGGVCVVFHGAPLATFGLDICCAFGEENVRKIASAVADLHPVHRLTANKVPLELTGDSFGALKNVYLQTDLGKLDCLSAVAGVGNFIDAKSQSVAAKMSYGEFRFLNIEALIASKKAVGRERDLDAVRRLVAIKEKKNNQKNCFELILTIANLKSKISHVYSCQTRYEDTHPRHYGQLRCPACPAFN